jgi:replicative superfamily II helicase
VQVKHIIVFNQGRPQYESHGVGIIITTHNKLQQYLASMTHQHPIESQFISHITDNLNAEIALGTVNSLSEAIQWLKFTFLYVRMCKNKMSYGITPKMTIDERLTEIIQAAALELRSIGMIGFDMKNGFLRIKELGKIASRYYLKHSTVEAYSRSLKASSTESDVISIISKSGEFSNIKVRDEEKLALEKIQKDDCVYPIRGNEVEQKVNALFQAFVNSSKVDSFSLISDMNYISQNSSRLLRALFEISLLNNYSTTTYIILDLCKSSENQIWSNEHAFRQIANNYSSRYRLQVDHSTLRTIESYSIDELRELSMSDLNDILKLTRKESKTIIYKLIHYFPNLQVRYKIKPISYRVVRLEISITNQFLIAPNASESFYLFVEDANRDIIYYYDTFVVNQTNIDSEITKELYIPLPDETEEVPADLWIKVISERWIQCEFSVPIYTADKRNNVTSDITYTDLLNLNPLPVTALCDVYLEAIYSEKFMYFNPIQTQVFHNLYHHYSSCLIGAPTGSGKTIMSELGIYNTLRNFPGAKIVYIAPLKALVKERVADWTRLFKKLTEISNGGMSPYSGHCVVELTGDTTPDKLLLNDSTLIITTPEKWDGITRSWKFRPFVQQVSLVIIDEIHLLGTERGSCLEMIVSRMNCMSQVTKYPLRIIGLSTALANAGDLKNWLEIKPGFLYNFRPSTRPIPITVHIDGFTGKHYCPRMATMNKPCYKAIQTHGDDKPVLIFVSSRRQTRLTAQGIISCMNLEDEDLNLSHGEAKDARKFLKMDSGEMEMVLQVVKDSNLKHTLSFGIGIHHAGLSVSDRKIVEELFVNQKIMVLVATSTVAWGVNFPCHMVIIKGTEYYDARTKSYVDYPITDVLQMMGRAGKSQRLF